MSAPRFSLSDGQWSRKDESDALTSGWNTEKNAMRNDKQADRRIRHVDDLMDDLTAKYQRAFSEPGDEYIDLWDALEDELERIDRGPHLVYKRGESI